MYSSGQIWKSIFLRVYFRFDDRLISAIIKLYMSSKIIYQWKNYCIKNVLKEIPLLVYNKKLSPKE